MSFIFTIAGQKTCLIVGDSLISYPQIPSSLGIFSNHKLKIHLLSEKHMIAYAGRVDACEIIKLYVEQPLRDIDIFHSTIQTYLKDAVCAKPDDFEFLYFNADSEKPGLYVYKDGELLGPSTRGYIGNQDFYKDMIKTRETIDYGEDPYYKACTKEWLEYFKTCDAMTELLMHRKHHDVGVIGNHIFRASCTPMSGFTFLDKTSKSMGPNEIPSAILTTFSSNYPMSIGVYFNVPKKGLVFISGKYDSYPIEGEDVQEFVKNANASFNINLEVKVN